MDTYFVEVWEHAPNPDGLEQPRLFCSPNKQTNKQSDCIYPIGTLVYGEHKQRKVVLFVLLAFISHCLPLNYLLFLQFTSVSHPLILTKYQRLSSWAINRANPRLEHALGPMFSNVMSLNLWSPNRLKSDLRCQNKPADFWIWAKDMQRNFSLLNPQVSRFWT